MRIALIWNAPGIAVTDSTAPYFEYQSGLMAAGCDVQALFYKGTGKAYQYPVHEFESEKSISKPEYWSAAGFDGALMFTWHRMKNVFLAMRSVGMKAIAIGDSDGLVSLRAHPWDTLRYKISEQKNYRHKIGAAKLWLSNWLFRGSANDLELIAATEAAHIFSLPNAGGVEQFRRFLVNRGATVAANKLVAIPYPVAEAFCTEPIKIPKANRVIAVGRWDSYQKNARLLAATLERLTRYGCNTEFLIVGNGAETAFSSVAKLNPAIHLLGVQPKEQVAKLMSDCRFVLLSSRWESGPIVANEMLAMGGTIVGTPIPTLVGLVEKSRFGHVSIKHTAHTLADAILEELEVWDQGKRNPQNIAAYWRQRVSPDGVAKRIIELLH